MSKRNLIWLAVIGVISFGFYRIALLASQQDSIYRTYAPLVEVDALIHQKYVEPIEDDRLVDGAIRGMMLELDPYSGYIAPDELAAYRHSAAGRYIGIGVHLGMHDGQLTVIAPIEQSPAEEAGILAGDVVLAIDNVPAERLSVADANRMISGNPGTNVTLKIRHPAGGTIETLHISRAPIELYSVKGYRRNGHGQWDYLIEPQTGIAYIRVSNFHESTAEEFDAALDDIRSAEARGLVLDLRFNPGGSLRSAVAMVDRFVEDGLIVSTVTRHQAVDEYRARPEGTFAPIPLSVLINSGSASASEIMAGSLQAHDRAVIVGTRSFGKGVVQAVTELTSHRAAISLTVAHYRLPNGRIIHKTAANAHTDEWGVLPDIAVPILAEEDLAIQRRRSEVDRSTPERDGKTEDAAENGTHAEPPGVLIDAQLAAALDVVRTRIAAPLEEQAPEPAGPPPSH